MTLEDTVTRLIAVCRVDANSYRRASEILVGEPEVAHFCDEMAENRLLASNTLEKKLMEAGKRPKGEILTAPLTEGWSQPTGNESDPGSVIEACHEAEERALTAFEQARQTLPEDWLWVLNEYSQHMHSALAKMHAWLQGKERGQRRERSGVRAAANRIKSPQQ
jgi:hypothetical protein